MPVNMGFITAVCTSPEGGVPKYPRELVQIGLHGLVGDYHNRELRASHNSSTLGVLVPNYDRHISIVAQEVYDELNAELGSELVTPLAAGAFGENILVEGLGDLSEVPVDACIATHGNQVELRVSKQNDPCVNLRPYHRLLVKKVYGRRGLLCAIKRGRADFLSAGLPISISW